MINLLTIEDVAKIAHCSVKHIENEIKRNKLVVYKPGKVRLFKEKDVLKWIDGSKL